MSRTPLRFNSRDFDQIKAIALLLPETEESVSHEGTPAVKVRGRLMCRLHESGEFISIRLNFALRDQYLNSHPEVFHLPENFKNYPYICMWPQGYSTALLKEITRESWRLLASKKAVKDYDTGLST